MVTKNEKTVRSPLAPDKIWVVEFHDDFVQEFRNFSPVVQREIAALIENLRNRGPLLGRPYVDTLKGAKYSNMKELRFEADGGVWRVAFAFDPERKAIMLVGGDKSGVDKDRFYGNLIRIADGRYSGHLTRLRAKREKK